MTTPRKRKPKASMAEVLLDLITEEELPEYQADLEQLVKVVREDDELAKLTEGLGPAGIKLAYVCTDPRVKRSVTEFARAAGVDRTTYYLCRRDPRWIRFKNKLASRQMESMSDEAMVSLMHLVRMHDAKGLRLYYELRGELVQHVETKTLVETAEERMKRLRAQQAVSGNKPKSTGNDDQVPLPEGPAAVDVEPEHSESPEDRQERDQLFGDHGQQEG